MNAIPGIPDVNGLEPELVVEFGRPEWQAHLGGDLYQPESAGDIWYAWAGAGKCWCVLPPLREGVDYAMRLEAAPFAPLKTQLCELLLGEPAKPFARRIAPWHEDGEMARATFSPGEIRPLAAHIGHDGLQVAVRRLPHNTLSIEANGMPVGKAGYEPKPELQPRDLLLRRELVAPQTVLYFAPAYAYSLKDVLGSGDERALSFRLFRLSLYPVAWE